MIRLPYSLFFLLVCFSGCSVGPSYEPFDAEVPDDWKNAHDSKDNEEENCEYLDYWWEVFDDERLNELEALVLENNRDLFVAFERVQEARSLMGVAASQFYPQVYLNPQYTNTGELFQNLANVNNSTLNCLRGPQAPIGIQSNNPMNCLTGSSAPFRVHELLYFMPVTLNYEVDLWGKIKDQYDSAKYSYLAQKDDYDALMLTLTANLAISYFQLRALDNQVDLLLNILKTREKALTINKDRYEEQITFYADVTLAAEQVDEAKVLYEDTVRRRGLLEDQIAVLVGAPASEFFIEHTPLKGLPPVIPSGIPSDVLLRRPDIAEAEKRMRSSHALVKYVYAQFFPSLSLTSQLGFESPIFKEFLKWISRYWMFGASSNQLIFDGFKTSYQLDAQIASFKEAGGEYQKLVLVAFQEVEDALISLDSYAKQYEISLTRADWAEKTYQLYYDRYKLGVINYIDVANTEEIALNAEIDVVVLQGLRFITTVQFIQALGGGW